MLDKNKLPFSTQEARDYYESSKPYFTIVKTHQPPRLNQKTMICDLCKKEVDLKKPYWKTKKYGRNGCYLVTVFFCDKCK